jgi:hypothetical protein
VRYYRTKRKKEKQKGKKEKGKEKLVNTCIM